MNNTVQNYPSLEYEDAAKILLKNIEKASTLAEIRKHFKEFAKKYTVIPRLWETWIEKERTVTFKDFEESQKLTQIKQVKNLAKTHFYNCIFLDYSFQTFTQGNFGRCFLWFITTFFNVTGKRPEITFNPFSTEVLFQLFDFPHDKLKEVYRFTKKYSTYPIPTEIRQKYKESRNLLHQILLFARNAVHTSGMAVENRNECFMAAGIEYLQKNVKNKILIIENYESAIGMYPCSKKIWKQYIEYLKWQKDDKKLLNLYSRYCRLFTDDKEVQEKYRSDLEQQSKGGKSVGKWWIDITEFEKDFVGINEARILLDKALMYCNDEILIKYGIWFEKEYGTIQQYMSRFSNGIKLYPNLANFKTIPKPSPTIKAPIHFNYKNNFKFKFIDKTKHCFPRVLEPSIQQNFSFCDGIIRYLAKSSNPSTMLKLQMSAKYFYLQTKSPICHNFTVLNGQDHGPTFFPHSLFINSSYVDFPIFRNITVTNALIIHAEEKPKTFSTLAPKLNLKISHLILTKQNLNLSEFKILTNLKLKSVSFDKVIIEKMDGIFMPIDEIISMLITVKDLCILNGIFETETPKNLAKMKRSKKVKVFEISKINQFFPIENLIEFAKENLFNFAKITVHFSDAVAEEEKTVFINEMIKSLPEATINEID